MQNPDFFIRYTHIDHVARQKLGLTMSEYCIADSIYQLSNLRKAKVPGWCNATKEYLGDFINLKRRAVTYIIRTLINKNILEKNKTGYLRTTETWEQEVIVRMKEIMSRNGAKIAHESEQSLLTKKDKIEQRLLTNRAKIAPTLYNNNNNILYNDKDKLLSSNKKFLKKKSGKGMRLEEGLGDLLSIKNEKRGKKS